MKKLNLSGYKVKKKQHWQDKAIEMGRYYGKNVFWMFFKFHPYKIERAQKEMIEEGNTNFQHLLQKLYHN